MAFMGLLGGLGSAIATGAKYAGRSLFDPQGMQPGADQGAGATAGRVARNMFDPRGAAAQRPAPPMPNPGMQPQPPMSSSTGDGETTNSLPYRSPGQPVGGQPAASALQGLAPRRRVGALDQVLGQPQGPQNPYSSY